MNKTSKIHTTQYSEKFTGSAWKWTQINLKLQQRITWWCWSPGRACGRSCWLRPGQLMSSRCGHLNHDLMQRRIKPFQSGLKGVPLHRRYSWFYFYLWKQYWVRSHDESGLDIIMNEDPSKSRIFVIFLKIEKMPLFYIHTGQYLDLQADEAPGCPGWEDTRPPPTRQCRGSIRSPACSSVLVR